MNDPSLHPTPISKYYFLQQLSHTEPQIYYGLLSTHLKETMPIVYTPTVGEGCTRWSQTYIATGGSTAGRGLYIPYTKNKEEIKNHLRTVQHSSIDAIVITDGERILGLGDLGVNGMGIPVGKLALYSGLGGVDPRKCLPITLDSGTNTESYLQPDSSYIGSRRRRVTGEAYTSFVDDVLSSIQEEFGRNTLIQFEDFGNENAFHFLQRYRERGGVNMFNDDIEGTASVVLAGVIAAMRVVGDRSGSAAPKVEEQTFLFLGAGEAGVGIADLISRYIVLEAKREGRDVKLEDARKNIWLVDSKGLIVSDRKNLVEHKLRYAHEWGRNSAVPKKLEDAVDELKPSVLIGVAAQPNTFTPSIIEKMSALNSHPVIFALSNPTSKCECTAEEAYQHSSGAAIFATGSPFDDVIMDGRTYSTGQGNNAYIFPGVGLGSIVAKANKIDDSDFLIAAETLAREVNYEKAKVDGNIYPRLEEVREVSRRIGVEVAKNIIAGGRSDGEANQDEIEQMVDDYMWDFHDF